VKRGNEFYNSLFTRGFNSLHVGRGGALFIGRPKGTVHSNSTPKKVGMSLVIHRQNDQKVSMVNLQEFTQIDVTQCRVQLLHLWLRMLTMSHHLRSKFLLLELTSMVSFAGFLLAHP
jgi:hypothetical protein